MSRLKQTNIMETILDIDGEIPQINDKIWVKYKAYGRVEGKVISILSVKYGNRLRLKIKYKIKVSNKQLLKSV